MKKLCLVLFMLPLLCASALAFADGAPSGAVAELGDTLIVVNCKENITLRSAPSTSAQGLALIPLGERMIYLDDAADGFVCVGFEGMTGYVLERYTRNAYEDYEGVLYEADEEERYNVNLFLSNFSEAYFEPYDQLEGAQGRLIDFAVNHIWYNQHERIELGDWGMYNTRVEAELVREPVMKYLGRTLDALDLNEGGNLPVPWASHAYYEDGDYYWQETDGRTRPFVILESVQNMRDGSYRVDFLLYGEGTSWENGVCRMTLSDVLDSEYAESYGGRGCAYIMAESDNLRDRDTWRLIRWATTRNY